MLTAKWNGDGGTNTDELSSRDEAGNAIPTGFLNTFIEQLRSKRCVGTRSPSFN